jgi:hypothetical protein
MNAVRRDPRPHRRLVQRHNEYRRKGRNRSPNWHVSGHGSTCETEIETGCEHNYKEGMGMSTPHVQCTLGRRAV